MTRTRRDNLRVRRMIVYLLLTLAALWIGACALAWTFQERLIFFPSGASGVTPREIGLEFEELSIDTARTGERLHGWWIPASDAQVTVVVHHGNGGAIDGRLELARLLHGLGCNVLLYDYAGYGASDGAATVAGVLDDLMVVHARAAELASRSRTPIVDWGESLGGALASESCARANGNALVLESAFTSLSRVASDAYPVLPVQLLLRGDLDTAGALRRSHARTLVLHGTGDSIVPVEHGRELAALASDRTQLVEFDGGHNDKAWMRDSSALNALRTFLASCAQR